jgi:glycosyltransferase involved in cell wall biosynthesis
MGMLDTIVDGETGFLAEVSTEIRLRETILNQESGHEMGHKVVFKEPRIVDYRASVHDIAKYLMELMTNPELRKRMGEAGRQRVVEKFDYRMSSQKDSSR